VSGGNCGADSAAACEEAVVDDMALLIDGCRKELSESARSTAVEAKAAVECILHVARASTARLASPAYLSLSFW